MRTIMNKDQSPAQHSILKSMTPFLIATVLILLVPAVSMQFSSEMNWGPGDFVVAGGLLLLASFAYVMAARVLNTMQQRIIAAVGVGLVMLAIWVELAVGIFH